MHPRVRLARVSYDGRTVADVVSGLRAGGWLAIAVAEFVAGKGGGVPCGANTGEATAAQAATESKEAASALSGVTARISDMAAKVAELRAELDGAQEELTTVYEEVAEQQVRAIAAAEKANARIAQEGVQKKARGTG